MRRRIAGLALLATATALGTAAPAAGAQDKPRLVVAKAKAFPVAATGGTAYLTVVATNAGGAPSKESRLTVALLVPGAKPRVLRAARAGIPERDPGKSRTLRPTAVLPADVPAGTRVRLRACVAKSCRTTDEVLVAGATGAQLIDTAQSTGVVFAGPAALLRMQSAWGDRRLPDVYRVSSRDLDDHAAVVETAAAFPRLSRADQDRLIPYFLPRVVRDALSRTTRAAADGDPCLAISDAWKRELEGLHTIPAAGGKVLVWYPDGHAAGARRYAKAFDRAWPKLTKLLGAPLLDEAGCAPRHGRLNVFVEPADRYSRPNAGLTAPIPRWDGHGWNLRCTRTPTFMEIEDGAPRAVVPHELMHAIQFAYRYSSCRDLVPQTNRWWDEGGANWAVDFVYPHDDYEHGYGRAFSANWPIWAEGHDAWPFWYFLTKTTGPAVMKRVFARLATTRIRAAVDASIPGGYAKQYPLYLRWLRNAAPVGQPGFPVQTSFAGLDGLPLRPAVSAERALALTGLPERTFVTRAIEARDASYCAPRETVGAFSTTCDLIEGVLGPQTRVYQHFTFPDQELRELRFRNGIAGRPGARVEAWLRLADGSWRTADWSGSATTLCRDDPAQDVRELYVVETNVAVRGDGFPALGLRNELRGRDHCELKSFDGTFSGTTHVVSDAADTTTSFHGTLRLDPASSATEWRIGPSSLSVDSMTGTVGGCAASIDATSFAMPTLAQDGPVMQLSNGDYTLSASAPPDEQLPVHLTGGPDCHDGTFSLGQFVQDIARSEAPVAPKPDGTIAGSATITPGDGVTEELSWSLAPAP